VAFADIIITCKCVEKNVVLCIRPLQRICNCSKCFPANSYFFLTPPRTFFKLIHVSLCVFARFSLRISSGCTRFPSMLDVFSNHPNVFLRWLTYTHVFLTAFRTSCSCFAHCSMFMHKFFLCPRCTHWSTFFLQNRTFF
jgi:hypothetical protein